MHILDSFWLMYLCSTFIQTIWQNRNRPHRSLAQRIALSALGVLQRHAVQRLLWKWCGFFDPFGQQCLFNGIVDFVCACMRQILTFQPNRLYQLFLWYAWPYVRVWVRPQSLSDILLQLPKTQGHFWFHSIADFFRLKWRRLFTIFRAQEHTTKREDNYFRW